MPQLPPPIDARVTLAGVAEAAGVSVATASKVLNGRSDVSPSTRARVQLVVRQLGYVGRRPELTETAAVELFIQGTLSIYSIEVIQGVLDEGAETGVDIVLSSHPHNLRAVGAGRPAPWVRKLIAAGRRAVVGVSADLTAADLAALGRARLPLVVIDPLNVVHADATSVGSTNFSGGLSATQHLLSLGHRRIAYLGGPKAASCNQARMHGFRAAMESAAAPVPEQYVQSRDFLYDDGVAGGAALLDLPDPPTAVFAGSDEMAVGVIEAARARGLQVPRDLSIVGFDDTKLARLASPQLTTIRQPLKDMGAVALRTALKLASGDKVDSHHVELSTQLVVRDSAAQLTRFSSAAAS